MGRAQGCGCEGSWGAERANNHEVRTRPQYGALVKASNKYKLTMAKGSAHMLRALRMREVGGGWDSTQVRRILGAQGRLPEARGGQGPTGFSRWDDEAGDRMA